MERELRSVRLEALNYRATLLSSQEWMEVGGRGVMTLSLSTQQGEDIQGRGKGGAGVVIRLRPPVGGAWRARGLTGCSMTLSTVLLMSAMASVYTAASSWISLWF